MAQKSFIIRYWKGHNLEKLNLPIIKSDVFPAKSLSMEEYMKFVNLNLQYTIDKKTVREQKKLALVNVPFLL